MMAPLMITMIMKNKQMKLVACLTFIMLNMSLQTTETSKSSYMFTGDLLSFWVTNLSFWVLMTVILIKTNKPQSYMKIMILSIIVLTVTFYNWNFMVFYIMFEMLMVIMIITVMSWGYQPERIEATMFMIVMTTLFSLPFFLSIMNNTPNLNFWFLKMNMTMWDYMSFMLIFMVKMPTYLIHMWLPKVHVESPVHGSMILAAIMLKLGCYGMIRMTQMTTYQNKTSSLMVVSFSMWSMLTLSMICCIQPDIKSMVAYSSIVHMMMTLLGISLMKTKSVLASIIIMLGHGTCSSGMFFICNQMYKTSKSRSMMINKGINQATPTTNTMWFMLCMLNAPMPPSINVMGEILNFKIVMEWSWMNYLMMFMVMLMSSCFSIMMYCTPAHGKSSKLKKKPMKIDSKSAIIIMMMILPTMLMMIKANMMTIN